MRGNGATTNVVLTNGIADFLIPPTAGLELKQGTIQARGNSTGLILGGELVISGGTANFTDPNASLYGGTNDGNNYIEYGVSETAQLEVSAGKLTVGSQIRRGLKSADGRLKYYQTGGEVVVAKTAAPENNRAVFEVLNAGSVFHFTNGSLRMVRTQDNPQVAALYLDPETARWM